MPASAIRLSVLPLLTLCALLSRAPAGESVPFSGELELILYGGIGRYHPSHMILDLECDKGRWDRVFGTALSYSNGAHAGRVTESEITQDTMKLKIHMRVGGDPWVPGGRADYEIELKRTEPRKFEGTFSSFYESRDKEGEVTKRSTGRAVATMKPERPPLPKDFVPVQPGEHPRFLFRKKDLPELRKRFETPLGRALEAQMRTSESPIALGVLYQLTGLKDYAMDALPLVKNTMTKQDPGGNGLGHCWGERLPDISITYDLCYDAWPEDFKRDVDLYCVWMAERAGQNPSSFSTAVNQHPASNYSGPIRGGGAICSLIIWGDKGPKPKPPRAPDKEPPTIAPLKDFTPVRGVPIHVFAQDDRPAKFRLGAPLVNRPEHWLWMDPLPCYVEGDVLASLGGYAQARPNLETVVEHRRTVDGKEEVHKLAFNPPNKPPPVIRLPEAPQSKLDKAYQAVKEWFAEPNKPQLTNVLFCYLRLNQPQVVKVRLDGGPTRVWLGGQEVFHEQFVRLSEGFYPLLAVHGYPTLYDTFCAEFVTSSEEEWPKVLAKRNLLHRYEMNDYTENLSNWEASGGMDPKRDYLFGVDRLQMYRFVRLNMGDGGFNAEGERYTQIAAPCPLKYAVAYRKMFGRDLSPYPDVTHFAPRYVMPAVFPADPQAAPITQTIYYHNPGVNATYLTLGWPLVPEKWKPGVLWAWNRVIGAPQDQPGGVAEALKPGSSFNAGRMLGPDPVYTFLHYPLDVKPVHPSQNLPLTYQASMRGFYSFRNAWKDESDIVFQCFLKTWPPGGNSTCSAGNMTLYGLGQHWISDTGSKKMPRWSHSVVQLPDDDEELAESNCGRLMYFKDEPDGSGVVSVNLDDVYRGGKPTGRQSKEGRPIRMGVHDRYGLPLPENRATEGISGMRSFGVDYSGKSGAPMLLVVVDKIVGAKERWWKWNLPQSSPAINCGPNFFTLTQGGATLKATFASPAKLKVEAERGTVTFNKGEKKAELPLNCVAAKAPAPGNFIAVITLTKGPPPEVKWEGEDLAAKITVGQRKVSFDGEKVVFGE